ncbi:hypothetical protein LCGC14_2097030 [marine sediment metagenome]|uniref:Uncharacterized protein n=1 Tax=marine sediment metagenome TaxID=412755 RepID=A0A0F9EAY1_9ZZZZ
MKTNNEPNIVMGWWTYHFIRVIKSVVNFLKRIGTFIRPYITPIFIIAALIIGAWLLIDAGMSRVVARALGLGLFVLFFWGLSKAGPWLRKFE